MHPYMYMCIHAYTCVHVYVLGVSICTCTCTYTCTYTCTCICTCIYLNAEPRTKGKRLPGLGPAGCSAGISGVGLKVKDMRSILLQDFSTKV